MVIKTKYLGIYETKAGGYYFCTRYRGKNHYNGSYSTLHEAKADKDIYDWARRYLKRRREIEKNFELGILISECDMHLLYKYKFYLGINNYPTTTKTKAMGGKPGVLHLHKLIMDRPNSIVDHKNRNPLDNRRENLRYCTTTQNMQNSKAISGTASNIKGVTFDKDRSSPWRAMVVYEGKRIHCGYHPTKEAAAKVRQAKAKELFGEFYNG